MHMANIPQILSRRKKVFPQEITMWIMILNINLEGVMKHQGAREMVQQLIAPEFGTQHLQWAALNIL